MKHFKTALMITLLSTQCWAASATLIMTAIASQDKNQSPEISAGFNESSFEYDTQGRGGLRPENKSMCYIGDATKVCNLIRDYERRMNQEYRQGAHDNITVQSCKVSRGGIVKARYNLGDDYGGDLQVNRDIKSCN